MSIDGSIITDVSSYGKTNLSKIGNQTNYKIPKINTNNEDTLIKIYNLINENLKSKDEQIDQLKDKLEIANLKSKLENSVEKNKEFLQELEEFDVIFNNLNSDIRKYKNKIYKLEDKLSDNIIKKKEIEEFNKNLENETLQSDKYKKENEELKKEMEEKSIQSKRWKEESDKYYDAMWDKSDEIERLEKIIKDFKKK